MASVPIPVIDLPWADDYTGSDAETSTAARRLVDAAADHGFVYIRNQGTGFTNMNVDEAFDIVRARLVVALIC
jgi:isopenicillin N synthase-like dioxygenase